MGPPSPSKQLAPLKPLRPVGLAGGVVEVRRTRQLLPDFFSHSCYAGLCTAPGCCIHVIFVVPWREMQSSTAERSDTTLATESRKYSTMYQTLLMEQLKLRKWDSVASVLDSMSNAPGMAPTLHQLMAVLNV